MAGPDLPTMAAELRTMELATCAGDARFHAEVHEPIAAARKAVEAWLAMKGATREA